MSEKIDEVVKRLSEKNKMSTVFWRDMYADLLSYLRIQEIHAAAPEAQAQNDLRRSFELIKEIVCGEASPRWTEAWATTEARGDIADICDVMLRRLAMNSGSKTA